MNRARSSRTKRYRLARWVFIGAFAGSVASIFAHPTSVHAEERPPIEVTPSFGWQFGGSIGTSQGDIDFDADWNAGASIGVLLHSGVQGELSYTVEGTRAVLDRPGALPDSTLFDVNIHYFQIQGLRDLGSGHVRPYVVGSMGATMFDPQGVDYDAHWFFSVAAGLGIRAPLSERLGLRLQGRFLLPVQFSEGSIFCGSGGCATNLSGGTAIPQGDASAGLSVKF